MAYMTSGNKPLPEQAAERICQYIADRGLGAGDKLPNEFQLAELCQVGRSTIREAIKKLTFEGQVEVVRGSGTFIVEHKPAVNPGSPDDDPMGLQDGRNLAKRALEFFDVRLILEPEVAAMAAVNATYKDCQKLWEIQREVEQCVKGNQDHLQADIRYHTQIAVCTHNKVIRNLMEIVVTGIPVFIEITGNSFAGVTVEQHRIITDAIAAGDATGARCGMITHLNSNRQKILREMPGEKG